MHVLAFCEYVLVYFLFFVDAVSTTVPIEGLDESITALEDDFGCRPDHLNSRVNDETLAIEDFPIQTDTNFPDENSLFRRQESDQPLDWRPPPILPKPKNPIAPPVKVLRAASRLTLVTEWARASGVSLRREYRRDEENPKKADPSIVSEHRKEWCQKKNQQCCGSIRVSFFDTIYLVLQILSNTKQIFLALHLLRVEMFTSSTASIFEASVAKTPQLSAQYLALDPYMDPLFQMFGALR